MNILCKLFGHQPPVYAKRGWFSPGEQYGRITSSETDGIGRVHCTIASECPRCRKNFMVCRVHLPQPTSHGAGCRMRKTRSMLLDSLGKLKKRFFNRYAVDAGLSNRKLGCLHNYLQIIGNYKQAGNKCPVTILHANATERSSPQPVLRFQSPHHVGGPEQLRCHAYLQVVQSIGKAVSNRELTIVDAGKDFLPVILAEKILGKAFAMTESFYLGINKLLPCGNLTRNLNKYKKAFRVIPSLLPFCFLPREGQGETSRSICSSTKEKCEGTKHDGSEHSQEAHRQRPSLPPNNAILSQRPALADTIQHAHSLIPLWIGRHFAMRAPNPLAARPQGVKS